MNVKRGNNHDFARLLLNVKCCTWTNYLFSSFTIAKTYYIFLEHLHHITNVMCANMLFWHQLHTWMHHQMWHTQCYIVPYYFFHCFFYLSTPIRTWITKMNAWIKVNTHRVDCFCYHKVHFSIVVYIIITTCYCMH